MVEEKTPKSHAKTTVNLRLTDLQIEAIDLAVKMGIAKDRTEFCRDAVKEKLTNTGIWSKLIHGQFQKTPSGDWNKFVLMNSEEGIERVLSDPKLREFVEKRIQALAEEKTT
jgi:Arc/MetJ-type ribon-helix-helix transcriptional regulator